MTVLAAATARRVLRALFALNALAAATAALVLALAPAAIPAVVGMSIDGSQNLLAYLLAAAEMAVASLAVLALASSSPEVAKLTAHVLVVFHAASALAGLAAAAETGATSVLLNVAARVLIVTTLLVCLRSMVPSAPIAGLPHEVGGTGGGCGARNPDGK